ncbi:unnamed protein product [Rodentolepis nana]|uniref:Nucleoside-diphosphate kinase n=1 Tax=Rodentolepis nana TaxID=102285 RepID=A0A0R3TMN4_RODNA|nr:unnamed protein product [Rodentolepis nana]
MKTGFEYLIAHQDEFDDAFSSDKHALFYADREKKPACFIVIGKPSTGKTSIAKMLVKEMRCQYIHATHLIERNISEDTSIGKYFKEKLLSGKNLSLQEMATLLKEATSLPECHHYGYVMDGFPSYFAFEEQLQLVENIPMKPDYVVHIEVSDEDLEKRLESQRIDPVKGSIYNFLNFKDPPGPFLKPTTTKSSKKQNRNDDELNLVEEQEERPKLNQLVPWHPDFPRLSKGVMERLLIRPEDTKRELVKLFELNADVVPKLLDKFFKHFPKSHVIRIDGNCPPSQMFHNLMVKVRALPLGPAISPFPLSMKIEGEEEQEENFGEEDEFLPIENGTTGDADGNDDVNVDWDEVITSLSVTKMPTEHSRWHLSEWQHFCPVQLYDGILEHGKVRFACGFLGFLYFLSSREAMDSFTRNPRPYLDYYGQFQPKSTIRIAILGFQESGAAALCQLIAEKCDAKLISLSEILKTEIEEKEKGILEKIKNGVEIDLIDKLNKQRKRELDEIYTNNEAEPPVQRLKKCITKQHPQVVEAVDRALKFARAQPCYLEPNRYVEALVAELERLEKENANIEAENRRPLNWVIEGLPPLEEVWQLIKERSEQIHKQVNSTRQAYESLQKIRHLLQQLRKDSGDANEEEVGEEVEEKEEDDENLEEDEEQGFPQKTKESCNPWAEQPDPRLEKAQKRFDEAASQKISLDPMPTHIFKLKDELGDRALMIHRLFKIGYGPFEGLEPIQSVEGYDIPAMENMMNTKPSKTDHSRSEGSDDDDAKTEPPEDPPISSQIFYPMPQPGPELDCVREKLVQYDTKWEAVKESLSASNTAYGYPVTAIDLGISKNQLIEDLLAEVEGEFKTY